MENLEKEIKYGLNRVDYLSLMDYFNREGMNKYVNDQVNYYLDTNGMELVKLGISMRLRAIDNTCYEFTIKSGGAEAKSNVSIKKEFTVVVDREAFESLISGASIKEFIKTSDQAGLYIKQLKLDDSMLDKVNIIGKLSTIRTFFELEKEIEPVNLDLSHYGEYEDYELEWETEQLEKAAQRINEIFKELSIKPLPEMISKRARFNKTLFPK